MPLFKRARHLAKNALGKLACEHVARVFHSLFVRMLVSFHVLSVPCFMRTAVAATPGSVAAQPASGHVGTSPPACYTRAEKKQGREFY